MDWLNKLFGNISSGVGNIFGGIGRAVQPMLSAAGPALGQMASKITQQAPSVLNTQQNRSSQPSQSNILSGFMPAVGNILGNVGGGNTRTSPTQQPASTQASTMQPQNTGSLLGSNRNFSNWLGNLFPPVQQTQQPAQSTPPPVPTQVAKSGPMDWLGSLFSGGTQGKPNVGQTMLGGGLGLLGQFMPAPKVPNINDISSVSALKNFDITKNTQNLDPALQTAMENEMNRLDQNEIKSLYQRYANLRPGSDPESDSNFKKDLTDLQRTQFTRRTDQLANLRFANMAKQMDLNVQEAQQLKAVADQDIEQIMLQFGLDYDKAMQLKEMVSGTGETLMASGLGVFQPLATASPMGA